MIWRGWGLDLRYALRALSSKPGTTFTVIATIAVAIGATTAVYSVVDGVLLRPLPYPEPDRLARIHQSSKSFEERFGIGQFNPQAPVYYRWLEADTGFESLGAYVDASFVLRGSASAEVLKGQEASSGFFQVLGVPPSGRARRSALARAFRWKFRRPRRRFRSRRNSALDRRRHADGLSGSAG
jgi:putative ABC transport system permease protein